MYGNWFENHQHLSWPDVFLKIQQIRNIFHIALNASSDKKGGELDTIITDT